MNALVWTTNIRNAISRLSTMVLFILALTAGVTHALQNLIYMASRGPLSDICLVSFSVLPKENDILFSLEKKFRKQE